MWSSAFAAAAAGRSQFKITLCMMKYQQGSHMTTRITRTRHKDVDRADVLCWTTVVHVPPQIKTRGLIPAHLTNKRRSLQLLSTVFTFSFRVAAAVKVLDGMRLEALHMEPMCEPR